jgi:hypothetical protein
VLLLGISIEVKFIAMNIRHSLTVAVLIGCCLIVLPLVNRSGALHMQPNVSAAMAESRAADPQSGTTLDSKSIGRSFDDAKVIPEAEAVHLLRMYLRSQGYDTKDFPLDVESNPGDNSTKGFYLYDVYVDTPERLVTIGAYGVNAETGDIWERVGCKRLESSAIASLQKQIRDASGLSASELERLRNMDPCI